MISDFQETPPPPPPAGSTDLSDPALLRRYAEDGDQRAFAALVRRHSGWVISISKRRCGATELAQESAQNVFLTLARKAPRLLSVTGLAPWLHRAAVLETAALLRRESRYRQAMKRHQDESCLYKTGMDAAAEEAWRGMRECVDEALNALAGRDREVLLLHHVQGMTFQEIARNLGATEAAVQRRGHRALEKLAARLRRSGGAGTVPVSLLGAALALGMPAEAGQAQSLASGLVKSVMAAEVSVPPVPGREIPFPGWAASPAALATVCLLSAAVPVWLKSQNRTPSAVAAVGLPDSASGGTAVLTVPETAGAKFSGSTLPDERLAFLRQALEKLGQPSAAEEPTKLGIQLRKYMLTLSTDDLEPVGRLLGSLPESGGEIPAVLGAYSTRLAMLDPQLALELLASIKGQAPGQAQGIRFSRTALLDALSRGAALPETVRICDEDPELRVKLIGVWATHHPEAAMSYAEERLAASPGEFDRSVYLWPWMQRDPAEASKWLDAHAEANPAIYERVNSLHGGFSWWAVKQMPVQEAVALTLELQDPLVLNSFVLAMYQEYAVSQPEVLAGLASVMQLPDDARPLSVASFLNVWRRKDGEAASNWVKSLPEGELKATAQRSLAKPLPTRR